jgi:hypothetical protein
MGQVYISWVIYQACQAFRQAVDIDWGSARSRDPPCRWARAVNGCSGVVRGASRAGGRPAASCDLLRGDYIAAMQHHCGQVYAGQNYAKRGRRIIPP